MKSCSDSLILAQSEELFFKKSVILREFSFSWPTLNGRNSPTACMHKPIVLIISNHLIENNSKLKTTG